MKILAIESASLTASVAVLSDGQVISEYSTTFLKTHSETLLPMAEEILASRMPNYKPPQDPELPQEALVHDASTGFESKADAFAEAKVHGLSCPVCETVQPGNRWISQSDGRYMNLFTCPEHGCFLSRIRLKKDPDSEFWTASRLVYEADEEMQDFYRAKLSQTRRRGRSRSPRKNRPA